MSWIVRKRSFLVLLMSLCGLAALLTINSHWLKIENVKIELAKGSGENLVFERIRDSMVQSSKLFEGKFFWQVPLKQVFAMAAKDRRVKEVNIYRDFPSQLKIEITPHRPLLAYLGEDDRVYPIAADATLLPPVAIADAPNLPFVRGVELKDEQQVREKAIELLEAIPEQGTPLNRTNISEVVYAAKEGFKIFANDNRAEIKIGDTDFSSRVSRAQRVITYLDSRDIKGRVIDARFSKKVVVRVRNSP